jgi:hypothetical protein
MPNKTNPIKFTVRYSGRPNQRIGMSFIIKNSSCYLNNIRLDLNEDPTSKKEEDGHAAEKDHDRSCNRGNFDHKQ